MSDGKTTHGFSMNTVYPLDRDFLFTDTVTLPICLLILRHCYPFIPFGRLVMLRHHYPIIPFGRLVVKRHHYLIIPCAPCSGRLRFDLVYIPYILTVSTLLLFTLYTRELAKSLRGQLLCLITGILEGHSAKLIQS